MLSAPYARPFQPEDVSAKRVLLIAQGPWHMNMYASLFRALPEIDWTVYFDAEPNVVGRLAQDAPANVQLIGDMTDLLLRLDDFAVCLTTLATPHRSHLRGIQIFAACSKLGIPVLELQHGLFQQGLDFVEISQTPGSGFPGATMGGAARNFCDSQIRWSGEDGIGLPQFHDLAPALNDGYVLILSNMHRSIFSEIERRVFYDGVAQLVRTYPKTSFVWKPHQAEFQRKLEPLYAPLMRQTGLNLEVLTKETMGGRTTLDLIRRCSCAVSSASSVLLELEMYAKPTLLYAPVSMEGIVPALGRVHPFNDDVTLLASYAAMAAHPDAYRMKTGYLKPFSPDKLRSILRKNWNADVHSKADVVHAILPVIEFLESFNAIKRLKLDLKPTVKG